MIFVSYVNVPCASDGSTFSNNVDIFHVASGVWSTAALSLGRHHIAAASLPNYGIAIFAGGQCTCLIMLIFDVLRVLCVSSGILEWGGVAGCVCVPEWCWCECIGIYIGKIYVHSCVHVSCLAQRAAAFPMLSTSSTPLLELGALQLSA